MDGETELGLEVYKAVRAHELELNRAAINFEHAMLAPLFLLNGGAAVAFLALLGATSTEKAALQASIPTAVAACVLWAVGLLSATLATYLGFQSQRRYTRVERLRRQAVEREILARSPALMEIVARLDTEFTVESERKAGWALQKAFHLAVLGSVIAFLLGGGLAAYSVL